MKNKKYGFEQILFCIGSIFLTCAVLTTTLLPHIINSFSVLILISVDEYKALALFMYIFAGFCYIFSGKHYKQQLFLVSVAMLYYALFHVVNHLVK